MHCSRPTSSKPNHNQNNKCSLPPYRLKREHMIDFLLFSNSWYRSNKMPLNTDSNTSKHKRELNSSNQCARRAEEQLHAQQQTIMELKMRLANGHNSNSDDKNHHHHHHSLQDNPTYEFNTDANTNTNTSGYNERRSSKEDTHENGVVLDDVNTSQANTSVTKKYWHWWKCW